MSNYDRWATKEGPDFSPIEICVSDWDNDENAEDYAPFDETHCTNCNVTIGAWLDIDPETTADVPVFTIFWIMDEDCETLFCEDCWYDATREVE